MGWTSNCERLEREARQTLTDVLASAECDLVPVFGRDASQVVARQVLIPLKVQRQLVSALAILPKEDSQAFDLDGLLIGLAAQHAVTGLAQGNAMPLLVEISFDIFATRAATERFFATCAKIDPRVSSRLIVLLSFAAARVCPGRVCWTASTVCGRSVAAWVTWSTMSRNCRDSTCPTVSIPSWRCPPRRALPT